MRDLHNNLRYLAQTHSGANVGTTGAANGTLSAAIDTRGFDSIEFLYGRGVSASAVDTIVPVILEAAATGDTYTSVANADLLGTEAALTGSAATQGKIGYIGNKRYLKMRLYGTGTATARVNGHCLGYAASRAPVA